MRAALLVAAALALAGCTAVPEPAGDGELPTDLPRADHDISGAPVPAYGPPEAPVFGPPRPPSVASSPEDELRVPPAPPEDPEPAEPAAPTEPADPPPSRSDDTPAWGPASGPAAASLPPRDGLAVRFSTGEDAMDAQGWASVSVEPEGGSFSAQVRAVPDATLRIDSLVRLTDHDTQPRNVTLTASGITDPRIDAASLVVDGEEMGLRNPSANVSISLAAGQTVHVGLVLTLGPVPPGTMLALGEISLSVA